MLPTALFITLDLYDRYFLPAYYEDTDMAFQIREKVGLNVLYQPFSIVTHAESTTYGGKGKEQAKASLMESGRSKFEKKWRSVLTPYHGPSKFAWAPKNEKWLKDHDDVFDHATRLYSFRVLFLAIIDAKDPLNGRLLASLKVFFAAKAHVTIVFVNRNADEASLAKLQWLGCSVIPLNELVLLQRQAAMPCRYDLIFAHSLSSYQAVRATVSGACPSLPTAQTASQSVTPLIIDAGADANFLPLVGALQPADRFALSQATVVLVSSYDHRVAIQRIIPMFTPKRRVADIIIYPRASDNKKPPLTSSSSDFSSSSSSSSSRSSSSSHNEVDGFGGRTGVVVGVDLSLPKVTAAVVSFIQSTVQLLASFRNMNANCKDAMVVHIVPLPSSSSKVGGSSPPYNSGHYDLPPLLHRLNGTLGAASSAASVISAHDSSSFNRVRNNGGGGIEIRIHEMLTHGSGKLAQVLKNARLHVVVTPPELAEQSNIIEHIHEAMLAGVPTICLSKLADKLLSLGMPLITSGPKTHISTTATSTSTFATEIQRLYCDVVPWSQLVEQGLHVLGDDKIVLRSAVSALSEALKRATKPNRTYQPIGGGGGGKNKGIVPPPPRIVARLEKYSKMVSLNQESKQRMKNQLMIK
mmetsp:Transcript_8391/g.10906  ORF Transcript_8391/g.10906 Transcript_8391/m.10906 type:complete len:638 (+) Transcript_8391:132-2045(+)